jgi:hypothetical protein
MITFKQFLSEKDEDPIYVRDLIQRDCAQFLEETNYRGFLLRGVKGLSYTTSLIALDHESDEMEYGKKMVRQNRKP